jgi:hypothetical protein
MNDILPQVSIPRMGSQGPKIETVEEYLKRIESTKQKEWLWEGIVPASGIVLLYGNPFLGKTRVSLALAATMCAPLPATLAGRSVKPGPVLYLSLEHTGFDEALHKAARGTGLNNATDLKGFYFLNPGNKSSLDSILDKKELVDFVANEADRLDLGMIVVDSLRAASSYDENNSQETAKLRREFERISGGGRRPILVIHHSSKKGDPRGSTDLQALSDTMIQLTKDGNDGVCLAIRHHGAPNAELSVRIRHEDDRFLLEAAAPSKFDHEAESIIKSAIIKAVETNPGLSQKTLWHDARDILKRGKLGKGISNDSLREVIETLVEENAIRFEGGGAKGYTKKFYPGSSS